MRNGFTTNEIISDEIAEFIGPNFRDYRPVAEIVSVFVSTFGPIHIDNVPEIIWAPWIRHQQLRDRSRNYRHTPGAYNDGHMSLDF